jgi:hypothetical protein
LKLKHEVRGGRSRDAGVVEGAAKGFGALASSELGWEAPRMPSIAVD